MKQVTSVDIEVLLVNKNIPNLVLFALWSKSDRERNLHGPFPLSFNYLFPSDAQKFGCCNAWVKRTFQPAARPAYPSQIR
jgi:hypothetical protein